MLHGSPLDCHLTIGIVLALDRDNEVGFVGRMFDLGVLEAHDTWLVIIPNGDLAGAVYLV